MRTLLLISIVVAVSTSSPISKRLPSCDTPYNKRTESKPSYGFRLCLDPFGVEMKSYIGRVEGIFEEYIFDSPNCTPQITHVTSKTFFHASSLPHISLECVELRGLENPFKDFGNLEFLGFERNKFTEFPRKLCADIPSLRELDVRNQRIKTLSPASFSGIIEELESLTLGSIELEIIEPQTFKRFYNLTSLSVFKNRLEILRPCMFDGLSELDDLDFHDNQLREIQPGTFSGMKKLTSIDLAKNRLESLPVEIFDGLEHLEVLALYGNSLSSVSHNWLHGHKLESLYLANNKEIQIEPNLFRGLNLEVLSLDCDSLKAREALSGLIHVHNRKE